MEMFNIMAMVNIFSATIALFLLLGGFRRYSDVMTYRNLGIGFVITYVLVILVQIHTVFFPGASYWYLKLGTTGWCITGILFYLFIFKHKQNNNKMAKKVAFFNESASDTFVSYKVSSSSTSVSVNTVISSLPTSPGAANTWFQETDSNGVVDACAEIPNADTATAVFKRTNNTTYSKPSKDFVGGRPDTR